MVQSKKPSDYGVWWNSNDLDEAWYEKIYSVRPLAHQFFLNWFCDLQRQGAETRSILEVGCGRAFPYARFFRNYDYHGTDISEKEVTACRQRYQSDEKHFFACDAIEGDLKGPYDLVYSHAVIDHVYDINAFLRKLALATHGWLYVSAYATWKPDMSEHKYTWHQEVTCFQNEVSPIEARTTLASLGCSNIQVFPVFVGNKEDDIPFETVIIASRLSQSATPCHWQSR